jgi:bifunctional non-homologous end joining protein LigD
MPLELYKRKRDFTKTPEPAPRTAAKRGRNLSYLIQKHDATRLHYDFRLELDGVLLSWAVTKGPSLNPADKRLAVRTEDHPLEYGSFEGTIPQGQYGGGTVMLWDTGTWEPREDPHAGLKKGHLKFALHGDRLKGGWDLIRMRGDAKREHWLLVKERDGEARANGDALREQQVRSVTTGRSMEEIAGHHAPAGKPAAARKGRPTIAVLTKKYAGPQLATLVDQPPAGDAWIHEIKFDGYRLLAYVVGDEVRLVTRNGNDWTPQFPSITEALAGLGVDEAVIDLEAVVLDRDGHSHFQPLQAALGEGGDRESIVGFAFDLLHLNGEDMASRPLTERKSDLQKLLARAKPKALHYSEHFTGDGDQVFGNACKLGLEGIISKRAHAAYEAGRTKSWLKIKCQQRQEFIILGYSDARTGDRALGALYLGYRKAGKLRYAGKVGTGFTMQSARDLTARFAHVASSDPPIPRADASDIPSGEWRSIHWVRPKLLCEVAFTEWTRDGHIRHPSFQGLREDKNSAEVRQEMKQEIPKHEAPKRRSDRREVGGIAITHPDRVISETGHVTKGELAEYYAAVAPRMLPEIVMRPISLLRCPDGIGPSCFYQRNPGRGLGRDVRAFPFTNKGKKYEYLYIEDLKGLMELVQMGAIEIHPWGARVDAIDTPDRMIFDLDPAPDVPFPAVAAAANDLRARLKKQRMDPALKLTGGKGLHLTIKLPGKQKWAEVKEFAATFAHQMAEDSPELYVATMTKAKRTGKIFVDYLRNDYTATAIAPYAVRARAGAPVALPIEWRELKNLKSADQFTIRDVMRRNE